MTYHFPKKILGSHISLSYKRLTNILRRRKNLMKILWSFENCASGLLLNLVKLLGLFSQCYNACEFIIYLMLVIRHRTLHFCDLVATDSIWFLITRFSLSPCRTELSARFALTAHCWFCVILYSCWLLVKEMHWVLVDTVLRLLCTAVLQKFTFMLMSTWKCICFTGQPYMAPGASPYPVQPGTYPQGPAPTYPAYPPGRPCEYRWWFHCHNCPHNYCHHYIRKLFSGLSKSNFKHHYASQL